ncbi:WhiB family transcriptional regulator [Streptomyces sp. NPDC102441]|uniref:WhiB family transcriptional regulator n=1 Tax=Streptomyces sp. NPDC102441 TaxID=3366176 RepID=UPI00381F3BB3
MGTEERWGEHAACRATDPEELFADGVAQNKAKGVCFGCPVRTECLAHALDQRIEHGVWGGMTERERRALLRRRSTVTSWRRLLDTARQEHQHQAHADLGPEYGAPAGLGQLTPVPLRPQDSASVIDPAA